MESSRFRQLLSSWPVRGALDVAWDLLRFTTCLHLAWITAWLFLISLGGGATPSCGSRCTVKLRFNEGYPWHTPDALLFYVGLYCMLLIWSYYCAFRRWVLERDLPSTKALKVIAIVLLVPAFLNQAFWKVVVDTYANVDYIDWNPALAKLDRQRIQPITLPLPNGTLVPLQPDDVILVGNGPLSAEQRIFVRAAKADQLYRFNGMTNLLPDEPVGHLFVRRILDLATGGVEQFPGEYWGLTPPLRRSGVLEWMYLPAASVFRERTMCSRMTEAVDVTLLNGSPDDVMWYSWHYGIDMRLPECDGLCREDPPSSGGVKAPGGWTSGFLGLLEIVEQKPQSRIHLLGMNFGAAPNQQHATHVERRFVQMLMDRGRVLMHRPPSGLYHSEFIGSRDGKHLNFPTSAIVRDLRTQGMRCGEWNVWWFPEWQWSPEGFYKGIPLPPFFHSGTELHLADADGNTLHADFDPLNCTQHAELLARRHSHSRNGRRLSGRLVSLRRFKIRSGIKLYGGSVASNVSMEMESIEDCEQRVSLIKKYEEDFLGKMLQLGKSEAHPSHSSHSSHSSHGASSHSAGSHGGHKGGGQRHSFSALSINTTQFHHEGYVIVDDVFSPEDVDIMRSKILKLQSNESSHFTPWYIPTALDPGVTIPNFMARSSFNFMHDLPSSPQLQHVLRAVFGGSRFRYCSHNDIGIDRIVGWHKDVLNDQYKHFQSMPLWQKDAPEGGHFIVKALVYLQDHTHNDDAITLVPNSHVTPSMETNGLQTLHPRKGSVIVFEQRATHRGRWWTPDRLLHHDQPRILVSLGFGRDNIFTQQFEQGTRARQADQCGSKCNRARHRAAK